MNIFVQIDKLIQGSF